MKNKNALKKTKERSVAYPIFNLESAVNRLVSLYQGLGKGPYSREDAAKGMGYSGLNGASARAVAALVQYGLIDRNGNTYSLSLLSNSIIHPTEELEKSIALKKAAVNPKLFLSLVETYKGQSLPGLLENIITRKGVGASYAKDVSTIFKDTLQFAGILVNGVVNSQDTEMDTTVSSESNSTSSELLPAPKEIDSLTTGNAPENVFSDKGDGWTFTFRSSRPFTRELKITLIDAISDWEEKNTKEDK